MSETTDTTTAMISAVDVCASWIFCVLCRTKKHDFSQTDNNIGIVILERQKLYKHGTCHNAFDMYHVFGLGWLFH